MATKDYVHWTKAEVEKLFDAKIDLELEDWDRIAAFVHTRTAEQCRQKWYRMEKKGQTRESIKKIPKTTASKLKDQKRAKWTSGMADLHKRYGPPTEDNENPPESESTDDSQKKVRAPSPIPQPMEVSIPTCPSFLYWEIVEKSKTRYLWEVPPQSHFNVKLEKNERGQVAAKVRVEVDVPEADAKLLGISFQLPTKTYEIRVTLPTRSLKAVTVLKKDPELSAYRQLIVDTTLDEEETMLLSAD